MFFDTIFNPTAAHVIEGLKNQEKSLDFLLLFTAKIISSVA